MAEIDDQHPWAEAGEILASIRRERGVSQGLLADWSQRYGRLGSFSVSTLARWEKGQALPSFDQLLVQVRLAHGRLMKAAHDTPDLDKACFKRANGETLTGTQRLELLAKHWREHVHELQAAEAKR